MIENLLQCKYDVCIAGGLGHVGLPLGLAVKRRTV